MSPHPCGGTAVSVIFCDMQADGVAHYSAALSVVILRAGLDIGSIKSHIIKFIIIYDLKARRVTKQLCVTRSASVTALCRP